MRPIFIHG